MTVLPAGYGKNRIKFYQMLVLAKRCIYELNGKASILIIHVFPLKSIYERPTVGDGISGLSFCRLLRCLFSTTSQYVVETVLALPVLLTINITQYNSAAFLILRPQLLQIHLDNFCIELM